MTTMTKTDLAKIKQETTLAVPVPLALFEKQIKEVPGIDKVKFALSARAIFTKVPNIQKCEAGSVFGALVQTAVLGLDPNPDLGLVYYVPRFNKTTNQTELEFKLGYRGMKEIVLRNPEITYIDTDIVFENDKFQVRKFEAVPIVHEPNYKDRGEPYAAYAVVKYRGEWMFEVLTKQEIMDAKNRSDAKTSNYSPWNATEQSVQLEMWKKTAFRRLCKLLPVSLQKGIEVDDAVIPKHAIKTDSPVVEVDYAEVSVNVEAPESNHPEPEIIDQPAPETVEAQEVVRAENKSDAVRLTPAILERIRQNDVFWNGKIYKGGSFGVIYLAPKGGGKDEKSTKVIVQSQAQKDELESIQAIIEGKKALQSEEATVVDAGDDVPF